LGLVGTRSVTIPATAGAFTCPECGGTEYQAQRVRRFVTLSAWPIVPLDLLGEYIECLLCKATFDRAILSIDNDESLLNIEAHFNEAIKRVMVLMMLVDRRIEESELIAIGEVFHTVTGRELTRKDIQREVLIARSKEEDLEAYLDGLLGRLNDDGKQLVVRAAMLIAKADGHLDPSEVDLLHRIGTRLELPKMIIKDLMASNRPRV
jgi:tellurite resistance protein